MFHGRMKHATIIVTTCTVGPGHKEVALNRESGHYKEMISFFGGWTISLYLFFTPILHLPLRNIYTHTLALFHKLNETLITMSPMSLFNP